MHDRCQSSKSNGACQPLKGMFGNFIGIGWFKMQSLCLPKLFSMRPMLSAILYSATSFLTYTILWAFYAECFATLLMFIIKITISSIVIGLKKLLFPTNSLGKLLSDSLLLDSLLLDSLLSDSSKCQSYQRCSLNQPVQSGQTANYSNCSKIGFNGAETTCRIAHILGILLMNSCNTDIFFGKYYHWQSVRFEL